MGIIERAKGKKPKLPGTYPTVDFFAEQQKAFQDIAKLYPEASEANRLGVEEMNKRLEQLLPGSTKLRDTATANIQSLLEGELPQDVQEFIKRQSAESAVGGGTVGSEFARNRTLRDLGLTSLQSTQAGLNAAGRWLAQASSQLPHYENMFVTPVQRVAQRAQEIEKQFQLDIARAKIKAAPSPVAQFWGDYLDYLGKSLTDVGIAYLSGGTSTMGKEEGGGESSSPKWGPYDSSSDPYGSAGNQIYRAQDAGGYQESYVSQAQSRLY
jgi:hypothetical protein